MAPNRSDYILNYIDGRPGQFGWEILYPIALAIKSRPGQNAGNDRESQSDNREQRSSERQEKTKKASGTEKPNATLVAVCSSVQKFHINGLIAALNESLASSNVVCHFVELPYNNLDTYPLKREMRQFSRIILCHSIHNRRFAITDVLDALYDTFLPRAKSFFGKENVAVIVHDFPWPLHSSSSGSGQKSIEAHRRIKEAQMESFQVRQPTTFQCCDLAMIAGKLGDTVELDDDDKQELESFLLKDFVDVNVGLGVDIDIGPSTDLTFKSGKSIAIMSTCVFIAGTLIMKGKLKYIEEMSGKLLVIPFLSICLHMWE